MGVSAGNRTHISHREAQQAPAGFARAQALSAGSTSIRGGHLGVPSKPEALKLALLPALAVSRCCTGCGLALPTRGGRFSRACRRPRQRREPWRPLRPERLWLGGSRPRGRADLAGCGRRGVDEGAPRAGPGVSALHMLHGCLCCLRGRPPAGAAPCVCLVKACWSAGCCSR